LNTKTIGDADATAIQQNSNPVHLSAGNKGLLEDIDKINRATLRTDSGFIPGTVKVYYAIFDSDNTGDKIDIIVPNPGEVWRVVCPVAKRTAGSSESVTYEFFSQMIDDTYPSGNQYRIFYTSNTSSSPILIEDNNPHEWYFGYKCNLQMELNFSDASGAYLAGVLAGRVR
jgi:hypothetical protein